MKHQILFITFTSRQIFTDTSKYITFYSLSPAVNISFLSWILPFCCERLFPAVNVAFLPWMSPSWSERPLPAVDAPFLPWTTLPFLLWTPPSCQVCNARTTSALANSHKLSYPCWLFLLVGCPSPGQPTARMLHKNPRLVTWRARTGPLLIAETNMKMLRIYLFYSVVPYCVHMFAHINFRRLISLEIWSSGQ